MSSQCPEAIVLAAALVLAMSAAGVAHVLWLKSRFSRRLAWPLDGGVAWRGKRLFGANKQVRGLVAMPPAAALAFAVLGAVHGRWPVASCGLWDFDAGRYAVVGFACGLAFMLAELPNSFLKRRLGIAPGEAPSGWLKGPCLLLDRIDSTLGVLAAASLLAPVPLATWGWMLLMGPASHAAFSAWLFHARVKARAL